MVAFVSVARGQERSAPAAPQDASAADVVVDSADGASSSDSWTFFSTENLGGRGLLDTRDPFPLAQLHLQLPIDTREVMEAGELKLTTRLRWANSYAKVRDFVLVDSETYELQLGGWYALLEAST